jgi:hypothetical protein
MTESRCDYWYKPTLSECGQYWVLAHAECSAATKKKRVTSYVVFMAHEKDQAFEFWKKRVEERVKDNG